MSSYLSPGVYIKEVSGGSKPISNASTSTGAFIGIAERGPLNKATFIANWTQFKKEFGYFIPQGRLAYAVYSFFQEGGTSCYVVRVMSEKAKKAAFIFKGAAGAKDQAGDTGEIFKVFATSEGSWGNRLSVIIKDPSDKPAATHFDMIIKYKEAENFKSEYREVDEITEKYTDFSFGVMKDEKGVAKKDEKGNPIYTSLTQVNGTGDGMSGSPFVRIEVVDPNKRPPNGEYKLTNGDDGGLDDPDYIRGLEALDVVDDILLIAIPDKAGDREVILSALAYCEKREDCFFIADVPNGVSPTQAVAFCKGKDAYEGSAFASSYGALYYPWVYIPDPLTGKNKLMPPSALIAGVYAYSDNQRGVHKAPAGTGVGRMKTITGLETIVTKSEHDLMHPAKVNVIRTIPNSGDCIWGACTLSSDPEWKYVNVRRLFMMLRVSIYRATQWVVFEPNDAILWGKVNRNITAYLTGIWRSGALFGAAAEQAFFVKVDGENNPQDAIDRGELHIDIGVAPVKPAEFIIFTIRQKSPIE